MFSELICHVFSSVNVLKTALKVFSFLVFMCLDTCFSAEHMAPLSSKLLKFLCANFSYDAH